MEGKQAVGMLGAALLAVGAFLPVVRLPFMGERNLLSVPYLWEHTAGFYILVIAGISALLSMARSYPGVGCAAILSAVVLGDLLMKLKGGLNDMSGESGFEGLLARSVQLEYGWAVMFIGSAILLFVAVGNAKKGERSDAASTPAESERP